MNADLLAMLGGGMGGVRPQQQAPRDDGKIIFTIKAGKMTTELLENGKYKVTPIKTRGELNLLWQSAPSSTSGGSGNNSSGQLKLEWKDRRTYAKDLQHSIFQDDGVTFRRVVKDVKDSDRVYLMQWSSSEDRRYFFWLQDCNTSQDDELVMKLNELLSDHIKCATEAGDERGVAAIRAAATATSGTGRTGVTAASIDINALSQALQNARGGASGGGGTPQQVDALSSILENLGIPPPASASGGDVGSSSTTPSEPGATSATTNPQSTSSSLTLADLQGAMAGLQTASPGSSSPPGAGATAPAGSSSSTTTTMPQSNETDNNNEQTKEEEEESKDVEEEKMEE